MAIPAIAAAAAPLVTDLVKGAATNLVGQAGNQLADKAKEVVGSAVQQPQNVLNSIASATGLIRL